MTRDDILMDLVKRARSELLHMKKIRDRRCKFNEEHTLEYRVIKNSIAYLDDMMAKHGSDSHAGLDKIIEGLDLLRINTAIIIGLMPSEVTPGLEKVLRETYQCIKVFKEDTEHEQETEIALPNRKKRL